MGSASPLCAVERKLELMTAPRRAPLSHKPVTVSNSRSPDCQQLQVGLRGFLSGSFLLK